MHIIKELLYPSTETGRFALRCALAIIIATITTLNLHLSNPFWAVMSVIIIMHPLAGPTLDKGIMRIFGTLIGAALGYLIAGLAIDNILLFIGSIFFVISIAFYLSLITRYPYGCVIGGITAYLIIATLVYHPTATFDRAIWRVAEILVGVVSAWVVSLLIFPTNTQDTCKQDIDTIMSELKQCFKDAINNYTKLQDDGAFHSTAKQISKKLDKNEELLKSARREFGTSIYDISLLSQTHSNIRGLLRQIKLLYLSKDNSLTYELIVDGCFPVADLLEQINLLFDTIITHDISKIGHVIQATLQTYEVLTSSFSQAREQGDVLQYPIEECVAFHNFLHQIHELIEQLIDIKQLVFEKEKFPEPDNIANRTVMMGTTNKKDAIQYSIKGGLSALLATIMWIFTNWPGGLQGIISSVVISLQKNSYDARYVAEMRLLGCTLGGGVGLLALHFFVFDTTVLLIILFIFCWLFSYIIVAKPKLIFLGQQANMALAITLLSSSTPPLTIAPALERLAGIFIGIGAAFIVGRLVWPSHPNTMLRQSIQTTYIQLQNLYELIILQKLDTPLINQYQTDFHDLIVKQRQLLEALWTYHRQGHLELTHFEQVTDKQRNLATILLAIASTTDLRLASDYAEKLNFQLEPAIKCVTNYWITKSNHSCPNTSEITQALEELNSQIKQLREDSPALKLPRQEMTNFLFYVNNIKNILQTCLK